ncbi:pyridoxamine 5'-phosphate oxidase family protein [Anaerosporobacter sp.]
MGIRLDENLIKIINSKTTIKALATVDKNGVPHVTYKGSFQIREDGTISFSEVIETSVTNKNLTASIWFDKIVAINFLSEERESYQVKAKVKKAIIAGQEFSKAYQALRERLGDIDLSTIWVLEPIEVREENFNTRRALEEDAHPLLCHLDRFTI